MGGFGKGRRHNWFGWLDWRWHRCRWAASISETLPQICCCPFFSLTVAEDAALSGNRWKAFTLWMHEVHKKTRPKREVWAPAARLQPTGATKSCNTADPHLPRLLQTAIFSFYSRRVETHTRGWSWQLLASVHLFWEHSPCKGRWRLVQTA